MIFTQRSFLRDWKDQWNVEVILAIEVEWIIEHMTDIQSQHCLCPQILEPHLTLSPLIGEGWEKGMTLRVSFEVGCRLKRGLLIWVHHGTFMISMYVFWIRQNQSQRFRCSPVGMEGKLKETTSNKTPTSDFCKVLFLPPHLCIPPPSASYSPVVVICLGSLGR